MREMGTSGTVLRERGSVKILIFFYGEELPYEKHARIFVVTFIFAGSISNGQLDRTADKLVDDHIARDSASSRHCIYWLHTGGIYTS